METPDGYLLEIQAIRDLVVELRLGVQNEANYWPTHRIFVGIQSKEVLERIDAILPQLAAFPLVREYVLAAREDISVIRAICQ